LLDIGANKGIYMPPLGDPASHGQQAGRPLSCTQRLRFGDGSQETPPEATATQPNPVNVISPTTLHKAVDEQLKSAAPMPDKLQSTSPVEEKKKGRIIAGARRLRASRLRGRYSGLRTACKKSPVISPGT
jgi:hypothetical protein